MHKQKIKLIWLKPLNNESKNNGGVGGTGNELVLKWLAGDVVNIQYFRIQTLKSRSLTVNYPVP
jgi:hypothetical protein